LRSDEVNLRKGPGQRYPIEWVYRRRDLPVLIEREFEVWRLVADQDGVKGWVHSATLTGRRGFVVKGPDVTLRARARDDADPVALLKSGVVGHINACAATADWCDVTAGSYHGWVKRSAMWGISPGEAVGS
jgi:SH3-like domain-containing protein